MKSASIFQEGLERQNPLTGKTLPECSVCPGPTLKKGERNEDQKSMLAGLAGMAAAALLLTACQNQSAPSASPTGSAPSAQEQVVTGTATADTSNETEGYGRDLGEQLAQQLMDAQSADIDGVSGCTITSSAAEDAGVEIRLHTEATGLVIENNVCTGITVEDRESTYQINAKKVILATGYGGFDQESVETFYPEMSNVLAANNPGNHSNAQKWIKELGGEVIYYPDANYIVPVYSAILRDNYEVGWLFQKGHTMWVNSDGVRFFDESQILDNSLTDTGALLQTLDDGYAYMIFDDANTDCAQYAQGLIELGVAWSASTVEELAEKAGLPADALADTVAAYNEACASGTGAGECARLAILGQ